MKHTKILATYGPAIASVATLKKLIESGVNAFRVNCSHGDKNDFIKAAKIIREASQEASFPVALLFDISGPKLRLDRFDGKIELKQGDKLTITSGKSDLSKNIIGVNHPAIINSVKMGERLLIDDGNLILAIESVSATEVVAVAGNDYSLLPGKGINLPDSDIGIPTITDKDKEDIKTAVEVNADFIALSFVRSGDDILEAHQLIKKYGGHQKVIAKLEKREAIENLEEIMIVTDGVMVARGDLGVEMPPAELPRLQKRIIHLANKYLKPVIVATQMLESMRFTPRATRAEINDVASAVFDHADAVMLSAETASGKYPLESVLTMAATICEAEKDNEPPRIDIDEDLIKYPIPYTIAQAVSSTNHSCRVKLIFALTTSGYTAKLISNRFAPHPIIAVSSDSSVVNHLALSRSVYSVSTKKLGSVEEMLGAVNEIALKWELVKRGDTVAITGGIPFGSNMPTNFMMLHTIG